MVLIRRTAEFEGWLVRLRDHRAIARINIRIRRLELGNPGDVAPVGDGVSEMRVDYGPGYRVYFVRTDLEVVLLLCGGDNGSQSRDISRAKALAAKLGSRA